MKSTPTLLAVLFYVFSAASQGADRAADRPVLIEAEGFANRVGALDPGAQPASGEQQAQWCKRLVGITSPMACGWINSGPYDTPNAGDVSKLTGLITVGGVDKAWGKSFVPLVKSQPPPQTLPVRPELHWESSTMDQAAMSRFQAEYLAAFMAGKP